MSDAAVEACIRGLADDLRPVGRLRSPWARASGWLAMVASLALVLAWFGDLRGIGHRLAAVPDMWLAVGGSVLTTVLGAVATFALSLPDRSTRWALLPLPGLALWLAASGMGCLRGWTIPGIHAASLGEAQDCFIFIVGLSIPLSIATILMVRRAFPLRPNLTAATAGLAAAAAAATLLNLFHPYDAGIEDILVHIAAIALVILLNRAIGGRLLSPSPKRWTANRTL